MCCIGRADTPRRVRRWQWLNALDCLGARHRHRPDPGMDQAVRLVVSAGISDTMKRARLPKTAKARYPARGICGVTRSGRGASP